MSIQQLQRNVNQLNKDIISLEKKMAELTKKEAEKSKKIISIEATITKNTSAPLLRSKSKQIENLRKDITKILIDKATISKKIADKKNKLSNENIKLQKENEAQSKKAIKQQQNIFSTYEKQISELTNQIENQENQMTNTSTIFNSDDEIEYDVFISHATEDKITFCDEFVKILQDDYKLNVWYDRDSLEWGDNIRTEIDTGLKKSKFGIAILSKSYFKKYWTNYELEGLFQRESNSSKLLLPIWHDITKQEVQQFSPTLSGKMAMNTAILTPHEIAEKLNAILVSAQEIENDE